MEKVFNVMLEYALNVEICILVGGHKIVGKGKRNWYNLLTEKLDWHVNALPRCIYARINIAYNLL